jgi:hypothetical protein
VFNNCVGLTFADLPKVVSLGEYAFRNCGSLSSVNIRACEVIGSSAFMSCTRLSEFVVPSTVTSIGGYAFAYCNVLMTLDLTNLTRVPSVGASLLLGTPIGGSVSMTGRVGRILVPSWLYMTYATAPAWTYYSSVMVSV